MMHLYPLKKFLLVAFIATMLSALFTLGGVASAHPIEHVADSQTSVFVPIGNTSDLSSPLKDALEKIPQDKLEQAKAEYAYALEHPDQVHTETRTITVSNTTSNGKVNPYIFVPGIGSITVRIYTAGPGIFQVPYAFGLYFPLDTAKALQGFGPVAAGAIVASITVAYPALLPFSGVISYLLGNVLNSVPNFVVDVCGAQGGGFTSNLGLGGVPITFCGSLPPLPL
ncbi:hypothetical protein [Tengunoibacter tsumagoiensis]|uniref:Uncharacterized protein n=1 Tax=Tengunoibacter tsumagoiensis TaxID=2014871 RepID=A0A402A1P2_9CHLR|nr:hypothetical protein [Tengunoibacter tsumagoiensis]GCE13063.1 hypothetical protein KTT_29220 [Tengunoibacter tsumagoiensis]